MHITVLKTASHLTVQTRSRNHTTPHVYRCGHERELWSVWWVLCIYHSV